MRNQGPRYLEIENWLRSLVAKGEPGKLIPSEVEVAAHFKVSRMTARQAVMNLLREGLVDRRRGAGTFISTKPIHRSEGVLFSFTEDMRRRGKEPSSEMLSAGLVLATARDREALGLKGKVKVVEIRRLRLADDIPLSIERVALIPECREVLVADLETGSLHEKLREIGYGPRTANCWLQARVADKSEAKLLDIPTGIPLLVETRVISDAQGRIIEFTETAYAANRYVIDVKLNCVPATSAAFSAAPVAPAEKLS
ncbi:MAG: GntR family transcriptional regulator [Actinomycetales bacterium]